MVVDLLNAHRLLVERQKEFVPFGYWVMGV